MYGGEVGIQADLSKLFPSKVKEEGQNPAHTSYF